MQALKHMIHEYRDLVYSTKYKKIALTVINHQWHLLYHCQLHTSLRNPRMKIKFQSITNSVLHEHNCIKSYSFVTVNIKTAKQHKVYT